MSSPGPLADLHTSAWRQSVPLSPFGPAGTAPASRTADGAQPGGQGTVSSSFDRNKDVTQSAKSGVVISAMNARPDLVLTWRFHRDQIVILGFRQRSALGSSQA